MIIQINSDKNIQVGEDLSSRFQEDLNSALTRFTDFLTRVEVHLADENGVNRQGDNDKRCTIEVRIKGVNPEAVTANAQSVDLAFKNATDKLVQLLRTRTEKMRSY